MTATTRTETTKRVRYCAVCRQQRDRVPAVERVRIAGERLYVCATHGAATRETETEDTETTALLRTALATLDADDWRAIVRYINAALARRPLATVDDCASDAVDYFARSLAALDTRSVAALRERLATMDSSERARLRRYAVRDALRDASDRLRERGTVDITEAYDVPDRTQTYSDADRTRGHGFAADALATLDAVPAERLRAYDGASAAYDRPLGRRAAVLRGDAAAYVASVPADAVGRGTAVAAGERSRVTARRLALARRRALATRTRAVRRAVTAALDTDSDTDATDGERRFAAARVRALLASEVATAGAARPWRAPDVPERLRPVAVLRPLRSAPARPVRPEPGARVRSVSSVPTGADRVDGRDGIAQWSPLRPSARSAAERVASAGERQRAERDLRNARVALRQSADGPLRDAQRAAERLRDARERYADATR